MGEIRRTTTRQEGDNRSTEEQVSLPDSEGKLGEVSRTVSNGATLASGEKRNTVETYSINVPGSVGDGSLHLVKRATTAQLSSSIGQQTIEQQVEQADPGDPGAGLRVSVLTSDTVRTGLSGRRPREPFKCATRTGVLDWFPWTSQSPTTFTPFSFRSRLRKL